MSGNSSTACDDIVLHPGQQPRPPDTTAVSLLKGSSYPERLHDVLSQCRTEDEVDRELRDDYEVHRRSADMSLNQYLDTLRRVHAEERSRHIHEVYTAEKEDSSTAMEMRDLCSNTPGVTREHWRLKILRDALSRDLLAMQETLDLLAATKPCNPSPRRWDLFIPRIWFCVGLLNPFLWAMCLYRGAYGLLVYGDATSCFRRWNWPRTRRIERYQERVNDLYRLLHKGQVGERNRKDLTECALGW